MVDLVGYRKWIIILEYDFLIVFENEKNVFICVFEI